MATMVYTFHITYEGLEDKIWRKVEVSSNYRLDQLGYLVLAAFDTMAYHLFEFFYEDGRFEIPHIDSPYEQIDMSCFKLSQMGLKIGDRIQMDYDFGTTQTFWIEFVDSKEMQRGRGRHYPFVIDGAGKGIIDDMHVEDLKSLIAEIDQNGKTRKPVYYGESQMPWDYQKYDTEYLNMFLKDLIYDIEYGYAPFWQENNAY